MQICDQIISMKYLYLLLGILVSISGNAAAPTLPAKNFSVNTIEGSFLNIGWGAGNGTRRVIICRAGAPVQSRPVNGIDYAENTEFGNGQQLLPGEYVIYDNAFTSFYVTGLAPATTYYFAVFEYNGTGVNTEYLVDPYLAASATTAAAPTEQTHDLVFSNITTSSVKMDWVKGNGSRRLIIARKDAPVTAEPVDLHSYSGASAFATGTQVGTGNYSVYSSSGTSVTITNLQANSTYHFAIYEYNGNSEPVYLKPAYTVSVTTRSAPTIPSKDMVATHIDGRELHFSWTPGNGAHRIMVAKLGSAVTGTPQNGVDYQFNETIGLGQTIGTGEYVVFDGNGHEANVYGLEPYSTYYFKIFEYDGAGSGTVYLTSLTAFITTSTAIKPTVQAANISASNITGNSLLLTYAKGNGQGRFVVARKGAPVNVAPQDLTAYNGNSDFGAGDNLGNGNYVLANDLDLGLNVHQLEANTTYHFAVFEYNGQFQPLYLAPAATFSVTTLGTLPVKLTEWKLESRDKQVELKWTTGMEENASHFNVQRSADGIQFTTMARVNASGNSPVSHNYSVQDKAPLVGQNYYRLEMVDIDGKKEYSSVLSTLVDGIGGQTRLLSNPVRDNLVAILPGGGNTKTEWRIINTGGQIINRGTTTSARLEISSVSLKTGSYWLQTINGNRKETVKFIKL